MILLLGGIGTKLMKVGGKKKKSEQRGLLLSMFRSGKDINLLFKQIYVKSKFSNLAQFCQAWLTIR
jgi:hypothetical protein